MLRIGQHAETFIRQRKFSQIIFVDNGVMSLLVHAEDVYQKLSPFQSRVCLIVVFGKRSFWSLLKLLKDDGRVVFNSVANNHQTREEQLSIGQPVNYELNRIWFKWSQLKIILILIFWIFLCSQKNKQVQNDNQYETDVGIGQVVGGKVHQQLVVCQLYLVVHVQLKYSSFAQKVFNLWLLVV